MRANDMRGEVGWLLEGGEELVFRPSFNALRRIESDLNLGIYALARKLCQGALTLEEMVIIIASCTENDNEFIRKKLTNEEIVPAVESLCRMFTQIVEEIGNA